VDEPSDDAPDRDREPAGDAELSGPDANPLAGAPAGWREDVPAAELADWYAEVDGLPVCADPDAAWFAAGCPGSGGPGGAAVLPAGVSVFGTEEAGDSLGPGPLLAGLSDQAFTHGLTALSDDALVGLLRASWRLTAWQDGVELAAVAELDARRMAAAARPGWSRASEHVAEELAVALVLTGRSADGLLGLARGLARLPVVTAGLVGGSIDRARAVIFDGELSALDDAAARAVAEAFIDRAGALTTAQLRRGLRAMVLRLYPDAARTRSQRARGDARVEAWPELSGNGALAGRELPAADLVAADTRITAIARALQSAGAAGTLDQVRAAVFCALLAGRDLDTLIPAPGTEPENGPGHGPAPSDGPVPGPGNGSAGRVAGSGVGPGATAAGLGALAGSVHLTLPAATWLGWSDGPGEIPGYGPVDGQAARDLAHRLAGHPSTRWHVTLTSPEGRAVAHACAIPPPGGTGPPGTAPGPPGGTGPTAGTGPPGRAGPVAAWLAGLEFAWLETAPCAHRRATGAYRPRARVRELVTVRHRTCAFPGCRRPARQCDTDHTRAWEDGGLTCECNLAP